MKIPVSIETLTIPIPSELFIDPICSSVSLLRQILGLEDDGQVTDVMLGVFLYLSQSKTSLKFVEFLAGEINSQLVNFDLVGHYRYQAYLFSMIIYSNRRALEGLDLEVFSDWT